MSEGNLRNCVHYAHWIGDTEMTCVHCYVDGRLRERHERSSARHL